MKKLLALLLALVMVLSLAACGGSGGETETTQTPPQSEETDPTQKETDPTQKETDPTQKETEPAPELPTFTFTQFGDATVTIVGAEFTKDPWGDDALRIYYNYTNTGSMGADQIPDQPLQFMSVTQDGQDLETVYLGEDDEGFVPEDVFNQYEVQPGLTSRCTMVFNADPNGGIVEISCYVMSGSWVYDSEDVILFTFQIDPKDLMGAPEPFTIAPILNPTYAANLPTSGSYDDGDVSIDGWEVVKGDEGENVLRVKLTVTNKGETEVLPYWVFGGMEAYQDGLGLPLFVSWYLEEETDADAAADEDLMPGDTVECTCLYELRNDHPVEVVIEEKDNPLRLGMICDVKN